MPITVYKPDWLSQAPPSGSPDWLGMTARPEQPSSDSMAGLPLTLGFGAAKGGLTSMFNGGSFASETLTHALTELREAYAKYQNDPEFIAEFQSELSAAVLVGSP